MFFIKDALVKLIVLLLLIIALPAIIWVTITGTDEKK
jgi:hypothetical protein